MKMAWRENLNIMIKRYEINDRSTFKIVKLFVFFDLCQVLLNMQI